MGDHLIWWLIGFIPGGIIGGYLVGRLCGREYRKRIEALNNENKELVEKLKKTSEKGLLEREKALAEQEEKLKDLKSVEEKVKELGYKPKEDVQFEDYVQEIDLEDSDEIKNGEQPVYIWSDDDFDDEPEVHIIQKEDFKQFINQKDCETLVYYQEDSVLTSSDLEVIHNQEDILGEECSRIIDDTEEDYLYIENEPENKIYEIVVEHNQSFYRDVIGASVGSY